MKRTKENLNQKDFQAVSEIDGDGLSEDKFNNGKSLRSSKKFSFYFEGSP